MTSLTSPYQASAATVSPYLAQKSQDTEDEVVIANMDFFPDLHLLDFQLSYRVDASQHQNRQEQALQEAMVTVNNELLNNNATDSGINWVCEQVRKGYFTLSAVPSVIYGEVTDKQKQYLSAVYAHAKSLLVDRYPELFFGRKDRSAKSDPDNNTGDIYLTESRVNIRQLMGKARMTVDLI